MKNIISLFSRNENERVSFEADALRILDAVKDLPSPKKEEKFVSLVLAANKHCRRRSKKV